MELDDRGIKALPEQKLPVYYKGRLLQKAAIKREESMLAYYPEREQARR